MSEVRAKHRLEVERINNAKEEEMEEVHKRYDGLTPQLNYIQ
jgi:hypothetical protein